MDRNRRLGIVAIVVIVALVAIAAIADAVTSNEGDKVLVMGDSITAITGKDLEEDLAAYDVTLRAQFGATVVELVPHAEEAVAEAPAQVIIALGTNDAIGKKPVDRTEQDLRKMIGFFPDAKCIHLVNINTKMESGGESRTAEAEAVNEVLDRLASDDSRIGIIDWDGRVSDDLVDDTVHPNKAGQAVLSEMMDDALGRCGRPWKFW